MGADTITVTQEQIDRARRGVLTQLSASGIADNYASLSDAIEALNMWDFVDNEASVIAHLHEWSNYYQRLPEVIKE